VEKDLWNKLWAECASAAKKTVKFDTQNQGREPIAHMSYFMERSQSLEEILGFSRNLGLRSQESKCTTTS
jgi:hypothetical protein